MTGDSGILDKVSTKDNLVFYDLKVEDDDSSSDIDGLKFAIYTEPDLNNTSSEFVVTAIAKYDGTTKIMRKTIEKVDASTITASQALLDTQSAIAAIFEAGIENDKNFNGFSGNQLNTAVAKYNQDENGTSKILYEETNDDIINKLLGTTDYKTELGIDELYWHVNLGFRSDEDSVFYYLGENSNGNNNWRGWAAAIPTTDGFVYYRGLNTNWNGTVREETPGLASVNNNTLDVFQTMLDASPLWEKVDI